MTAEPKEAAGEDRASCRTLRPQLEAMAERRFLPWLEESVNPGAYARDRDNTPLSRAVIAQAASCGVGRYGVPRDCGGEGAPTHAWGLLLEWLGYACPDLSLPLLLSYRQAAADLVYRASQGKLRGAPSSARGLYERYVLPSVAGNLTLSLAYTEGADPFSFRSRAKKTPSGYVLNGEKSWVTAGTLADAVITLVPGEQGDLMAFVIERGDAGVTFEQRDLMGLRGLGVSSMRLADVNIPMDRILVASDALTAAQAFFNERRLTLPCAALGRTQRVFEQAIAELGERIRYRLPVTEMQAVQGRIGRIFVAIQSARSLLYQTLEGVADGESDSVWDAPVSASKVFASQQCETALRELAEILGGVAYDRKAPYERALRDVRALLQLAGTQATLEVDLGIKAIAEVQQRQRRARKRS